MKKLMVAMLALWMGLTVNAALADGVAAANGSTKTPVARHRMKRQSRRIKQGVKSGELTKGEATELKGDHKALNQEIKDAKSDGVVTKDERKQIRKDQNAESKKIYDLKHNDEKRPVGTPVAQ